MHWLTVPLLIFIFFALLYLYFFSTTGYFSYLNMLEYKNSLQTKNQNLELQKQQLTEQLKRLKNDSEALEAFTPLYFLYGDDVSVIKFLQQNETALVYEESSKQPYNILVLQRYFIATVTALMFLITTFFWYRDKSRKRLQKKLETEVSL